VPTIAESPPIEVKIVEARDPSGPFGAKEASEGPVGGFGPAIGSAIAEAIGIRVPGLPLSPDRVLETLHARRREERLKETLKERN
jgi:4-hydroxybenzoyl-CoA reductase subunit alpha